jgi:hypothetical protein
LGWKFAALSGQDTKRWQRNRRQSQLFPPAVSSHRSPRPLGGTPASSSFANAGFEARPSLPAGFIPTAITNGDFNGDGKMDFAISNGGDNTIYVFLGNGDGTFKVPEILYTQGQSPDWITAVQLRKNGPLDLAVTNGDSNTVEVFLGNGDGTFQASAQTSLPQIPTFILAADVNNDGNQDLIVGLVLDLDAIEPQIEVLLGNGAGGFSGTVFSEPINISTEEPVPTGWIAAGDLNNDGYIDLVTTVTGYEYIPYLSHSGGAFSVVDYLGYDEGQNLPLVVGLGDMDEDGCLDAVQLGVSGLVSIAKGSCDGDFPRYPNPAALVGDLDPAIQVVDVNGDGHLDVVGSAAFIPDDNNPEAGAPAGYLVSVLDGDGKGDLGLAQVYRGGTDAYSLIVADFNGDGFPEILTASSLENLVSVFTNDGSGNYGPPQGETIGYTLGPVNAPDNLAPLVVADVNGDGKPDLLLVEYNEYAGDPPELTAILNNGMGNFLPPVRSAITVGESDLVSVFVVGAFRNPATPDVIYVNIYDGSNSVFDVAFFAGNGKGTFNPPVTLATLPNPQQVVAGDFNNDGKLDFAVMGTDATEKNWEFDVFFGHGDGTFTQLPSHLFPMLGTDSPQQLIAVDLNHDGKLDLLIGLNANDGWVASGDDLIEALGNGDGTFQTPTILISHFGAVAVADVNGDGYPDLIQNRDPKVDISKSLLSQPGITVYLGSADGTFHQQPSYDLPGLAEPSFNPAMVGDFNGDGIPDVAVRYWVQQPITLIEPRLVVLQGVGDGTFLVSDYNYQLQALGYPVVGADFNGDGATDLVELTGMTSSFTTIPAAPAPSLYIALDSSPVVANAGSATVSLYVPATSSQTVTLSASDPAIQLPASVQFNTGQQSQNFSFTLGSGFDTTHVFALYATLGTQTAVVYGTKPNPNLTVGVSATLSSKKFSVEPGENAQVVLTLTSEGNYSGTFSSLECSGLPAGSCSFNATTLLILPNGTNSVEVTFGTSTSTPFGETSITISSTDGFVTTVATFQLGVGDFSLSIAPTTLISGPIGDAAATISSTATNSLDRPLSFVCTGLPAGSQCEANSTLYTVGPSTGFSVDHTQLAANDYPFQITGTAGIVSHTISAVLRVGDFTASLDKTTATLSGGQAATFNVTLTSLNHYNSSITVACSPPVNVSCAVSPLPATLTDDGITTVQLIVTDTAAAAASHHGALRSSAGGLLFVSLVQPVHYFSLFFG